MKSFYILAVIFMSLASFAGAKETVVAELKAWEKFRAEAYRPTKHDKLTIGYGFTDKKLVAKGKMDIEEADAILDRYADQYLKMVDKTIKVKLNDNQRAALAVFAYNVGTGAFQKSTLVKYLNKGYYQLVPKEMMRWNKESYWENGVKKTRVLKGLTNRRIAEIKLWLKEVE